MHFRPTRIEGVVIVELEVHRDSRGCFARTFCEDEFRRAQTPFRVVQANVSHNSHRHTLRGMHYQRAPHGEPKIVSCTKGRIFDVAVDVRPSSPTYLQWEAVELAPDLGRSVYISEGLAHGFITLEESTDVHYLMGAPYVRESARGLRWDDPAIAIEWPAAPTVISDKDASYPLLRGPA